LSRVGLFTRKYFYKSKRRFSSPNMDLDPLNTPDTCGSFETKVIKISKELDSKLFDYPVSLIQKGEVVAFPTETVYGLGANALDSNAVKKIFSTKRRPVDNPLIVHVSSEEMLISLTSHIPQMARTLIERFWPGPLTLLLPKNSNVPAEVTCGQPTIAVRMPSHPIALRLISLSNVPIAAPSANLSGRPSPTSAQHVVHDLTGRCPCIIDGGDCDVGLESTVVDLERRIILRPGGITLEQLRVFVPDIQYYEKEKDTEDLESKPPTPGLKYRHYSPKAQVVLLDGQDFDIMKKKVLALYAELRSEHKVMGLIHTQPHRIQYPQSILADDLFKVVTLGDGETPIDVAKGLFKALRELDEGGASLIVMEGIAETHEGVAVMNRIRKAASMTVPC